MTGVYVFEYAFLFQLVFASNILSKSLSLNSSVILARLHNLSHLLYRSCAKLIVAPSFLRIPSLYKYA
nr:MAG TPA: hypothetical protein [Bacteriophage sp.]